MKHITYWKERGWRWIVFGGVMTATIALTTRLLLSNLYLFLSFDDQFSAIFAQIEDAPMQLPILLVLIASWLYCLLGDYWFGKGRGGKVAAVAVGIIVWMLLLVGTLLLTKVNTIRFGDVLFSLLDLLQSGVL